MPSRIAFTVDLEQDAPPFLDTYRGAEEGMPRLLAILRALDLRATVFATGDVARRYPALIREIVDAGHELACHGDTHKAFDAMSEAEAEDEIARSSETLRAFAPVRAFRAPYLRLPPRHLGRLRAHGYGVDSSEGAYKGIGVRARREDGLSRVPASLTSSALRLPRIVRDALVARCGPPVVLFVHPWELVDLRATRIRWDCRAGTGPGAVSALSELLAGLARSGTRVGTLAALVEEHWGQEAREQAHESEGQPTHG